MEEVDSSKKYGKDSNAKSDLKSSPLNKELEWRICNASQPHYVQGAAEAFINKELPYP